MDHGENDKRFYVYLHKDKDGNVRYVGSGSHSRIVSNSSRTKEHLELWPELEKVKIAEGLTKQEARELEDELLKEYWDSGFLLNKNKESCKIKPILFEEFDKYLYYDETSPTCLRWKVDIIARGNHAIKKAGDVAGCYPTKRVKLYGTVFLKGKHYKVHRVIWCLCSKQDLISDLVIDHINGDPKDNRIANLRLVSIRENALNCDYIRNANLFGKIRWESRESKWVVVKRIEGKRKYKQFMPRILFPDDDFETAKQKAYDLAKEYLDKLEGK